MKVLLGVVMVLRSIVMFLILIHNDGVGNKTFPEGQEKVVKLTALVLNLIISLLLLMDMSTVFLMILSGILCVVRGTVVGSVFLVIVSDILCEVHGTVLLVKLGTVDLVSMVLSDILGKIFFNGNCLSMIYLVGQVLL